MCPKRYTSLELSSDHTPVLVNFYDQVKLNDQNASQQTKQFRLKDSVSQNVFLQNIPKSNPFLNYRLIIRLF